MRTICPSCDTAYTIPDDRIGPKGRKVRCTRCGGAWKVMPESGDVDPFGEEFTAALAPDSGRPAAVSSRPAPAPDPFDSLDDDEGSTRSDLFDDTPAAASTETSAEPPPAEPPAAEPEPAPPRRPADVRIRVKRRSFALRMPPMPAAFARLTPFFGPLVFATALLVVAALFVFRNTVVAAAPGLAGFYAMVGLDVNLRGLTFGRIETLREVDNGQSVLVVEGSLANPTGVRREVPALRFALRDGDNQELYAWSVDPRATTIAPGDQLRFRTRLVAPPERAADLQVRFIERRNQQAGLP